MADPRAVPVAPENEDDVIGCLLWSGMRCEADEIIAVLPSASAFHSKRNQVIYSAMLEVARVQFETISDLTVAAVLEQRGKLQEVGGRSHLIKLKLEAEYSLSAITSAQIVRDCFLRRLTIESVRGYADAAFDKTEPIEDTIRSLQAELIKLDDQVIHDDVAHISEIDQLFVKQLEEYQSGEADKYMIRTGIDNLDGLVNGFNPGQFIVIAGGTGQGKTTLAVQIAYHNATCGKSVLINSLEMLPLEIYTRLICSCSSVDSNDIRREHQLRETDYDRLTKAREMLNALPIYFDKGTDKTNAGIYTQLRKQIQKRGVKLAVIDYIGLIQASKKTENKTQEVTFITRELKRMAMNLQIPIIGLAQLSRANKARTDSEPRLEDLRDSGSIEQDADMVMFIHEIKGEPNNSRISVKKNRAGACGYVDVINERQYTRLKPLDRFHANLPEAEREFL